MSEGALVTEGIQRTLAGSIVDRLRCPTCRSKVRVLEDEGGIECPSGHIHRLRSGYLDCSGSAPVGGTTGRTFASFGFEWNTFDDVRDEDQEFAEVYFRDLDLAGLAGQVGLDAGCGKGRYSRFLAEHLGALVALDGSSAVEAAVTQPTVRIRQFWWSSPICAMHRSLLRASISSASLGVLHHLDEPRRGFERLVALLAPTGRMLLYLYSRPQDAGIRGMALWVAALLRTGTVRLPHRLLKLLSAPIAVRPVRGCRGTRAVRGEARSRPSVRVAHGCLPRKIPSQPGARHLRPAQCSRRAPLRVGRARSLVRRCQHGGGCGPRRDRLVHPGPQGLTVPVDRQGADAPRRIMAVILSHNAPASLARCLQAVLDQTTPPEGVLVVDNASSPPAVLAAARSVSNS